MRKTRRSPLNAPDINNHPNHPPYFIKIVPTPTFQYRNYLDSILDSGGITFQTSMGTW
jgi:hypothetical protein